MTNKPEHTIAEGRVRAAIWTNTSESGTRHTFTLERRYKQGDSWKSATSFYGDDIERLVKVLVKVMAWLPEKAPTAKEEA